MRLWPSTSPSTSVAALALLCQNLTMIQNFLSAGRRWAQTAMGRQHDFAPEEGAYRRIVRKQFIPKAIIDVGAYQGEWTRMANRVFGPIPTLMIEAQPGKVQFLEQVCRDLPNVTFRSAVLGEVAGQAITFYEMETGSSIMPERSNVARIERSFVSQTLDDVAQAAGDSLFLKIDVQGAELCVLRGGTRTLARASLVQLEVALLPYNEGAPAMLEVMNFMDAHDFVPYDFCGFSRPTGGDLIQIDILFAPRRSNLRPTHFEFNL